MTGVTDSDAVCMQAAVPRTDVHEHCTTHDDQLGIRACNRYLWQNNHGSS